MNQPAQTATNVSQSFIVKGQYIKDLSFENPHAPQSLTALANRPAIDVNVDLKAQKLQDDVFEMSMHIAARASAEGNTLFLVDLAYAGIFQFHDRLSVCAFPICPSSDCRCYAGWRLPASFIRSY